MPLSEDSRLLEYLVKDEGWLYFTVLSIVREPDIAMDVSQEAIARALSSKPAIDNPGALRAWLIKVARNVWMDMLRARCKESLYGGLEYDGHSEPPIGILPEEFLESRETREYVREAISRLDILHRVPVVMRQLGNMSYGDIALALGISQGLARSRVYHAMRQLTFILAEVMGKEPVSMNCRECRSSLPEYLAKALNADDCQEVDEHLAMCPECRKELEIMGDMEKKTCKEDDLFEISTLIQIHEDGSETTIGSLAFEVDTEPKDFEFGFRYNHQYTQLLWLRDSQGENIPFKVSKDPHIAGHSIVNLKPVNLPFKGSLYKFTGGYSLKQPLTYMMEDGRCRFYYQNCPGSFRVRNILTVKIDGRIDGLETTPKPESVKSGATSTIIAWEKIVLPGEMVRCSAIFKRQ